MTVSSTTKGEVHDLRSIERETLRPARTARARQNALFYPSIPAGGLPDGWSAATSPDDDVAAVVLTAPVERAELEFLLDRPGRDVLPLIAMEGGRCGYADAYLKTTTASGIAEAFQRVAPITERVSALPDAALFGGHPENILLARIHTRACDLAPVLDPETKDYVAYPLAGRLIAVGEIANVLSEKGYLSRSFFDRFHVCPECRSSRLNVREECHRCRSANLVEEGIIHHFGCAHEAGEAMFIRGQDLICPKCLKPLRHIGIDYDRPGSVQTCRACGHMDDTTTVGFVCIDCGRHHSADAIGARDWYSYSLTPLGIQALLSAADVEAGGSVRAPLTNSSTFKVLLNQAIREAEHLHSPFTVLEMEFRSAAYIRREDPRLWAETLKLTGDVVGSAVRPVDAMLTTDDGMYILMPRLKAEDSAPFAARIVSEMQRVLRVDPGTLVVPLESDAVYRLLREMR